MYNQAFAILSLWMIFGAKAEPLAAPESDIALGSIVTIRHVNTEGGYLHSHALFYPNGSQQQQVTLYSQADSNNDWQIFNTTDGAYDAGYVPFDWEHLPPEYVNPTMFIKFRHLATEKHLHSHDMPPPVSDELFQSEVTGYGMPGFLGDANDDWLVEIENKSKLLSSQTPFRLRHRQRGCYLFSHNVTLPKWGLEQQEVTCNSEGARDANSLWIIETASHPLLPPTIPQTKVDENPKSPQTGFFAKLWQLQQVVWTYVGLMDSQSCKDD